MPSRLNLIQKSSKLKNGGVLQGSLLSRGKKFSLTCCSLLTDVLLFQTLFRQKNSLSERPSTPDIPIKYYGLEIVGAAEQAPS
jgi:hypothetical protein